MKKIGCVFFLVAALVTIMFYRLPSVAETDGDTELAEEVRNPVANLIRVPFWNNFNFGIGPNNVTQRVLNVQPVIPFSLSPDRNLITRTTTPIIRDQFRSAR